MLITMLKFLALSGVIVAIVVYLVGISNVVDVDCDLVAGRFAKATGSGSAGFFSHYVTVTVGIASDPLPDDGRLGGFSRCQILRSIA
jgi:hypothetical protein